MTRVSAFCYGTIWLLGALGCQSGRVYTAANLPPALQAPPVTDVQTLDLSRLAGPAVPNDLIGPGDVIEVSIVAALSADAITNFPVHIGDDGTGVLSDIGPIRLAGLNRAEAERAIAAACVERGVFRQPTVTVTMKRQQVNNITVLGAVKNPGVYPLPRASSYLLPALVAAGGLADDADGRVRIGSPTGPSRLAGGSGQAGLSGVQLASNAEGSESRPVSYVCLNLTEAAAHEAGGHYLADGSTVMVERRRPQPYQVIGLVKNPGEYEFRVGREERLIGAIARAGGVTQSLADKVRITRLAPDGQEAVIEVSLERAKRHREENIRLQPGDVISVEHNAATIVLDTIKQFPFTVGASIPIIPY